MKKEISSWNFDKEFKARIRRILDTSARELSRNKHGSFYISKYGRDEVNHTLGVAHRDQGFAGPGYYDIQSIK